MTQYTQFNSLLNEAGKEAVRLGGDTIHLEHLFLGIFSDSDSMIWEVLHRLHVEILDLRKEVEESVKNESFHIANASELVLAPRVEHLLEQLNQHYQVISYPNEISSEVLMLEFLRDEGNAMSKYLHEKHNIDSEQYIAELQELYKLRSVPPTSLSSFDNYDEDENDDAMYQADLSKNPKSDTPALDAFSIDMTKCARDGELDPVDGRDIEISRVLQILSRRKKNNPILLGEPGVGKSAIVEGLAMRIVARKVPHVLLNKRIVSLDLASIVAGTKYRGQFEERIKKIIHEVIINKDIILFIDEIHTIVGAGGTTGSLDAANMLKPALSRGEIQCIGATTLDEYRKTIEHDGALERRFQKVIVSQTDLEETKSILMKIQGKYEKFHKVKYTDKAIDACVKLAIRYISDRALPDKAIDALDEAGSFVRTIDLKMPSHIQMLEQELDQTRMSKKQAVKEQKFELAAAHRDKERYCIEKLELEQRKWERELLDNPIVVDENHIAKVVSMMTGIPITKIAAQESSQLLQMEQLISEKIIGQDDAIEKVVKAIRRNRSGLRDPNRPIGCFLFLGPTGVGKTELAKKIAEILFTNRESLIRIDMSEYMEKFAVSRLVGAPPGYVGYEEGGQLTEKVRRQPYSVILLDEIEKAHPDVFNLLLQLMDDGQLTDSVGRVVSFKNTIIILTSNLGSRQVQDFGQGVGFNIRSKVQQHVHTSEVITKALRRSFSPEFINRLDDLIIFKNLDQASLEKIIQLELDKLVDRLKGLGHKLNISNEVIHYLSAKGFDAQYGARPIKRAIQEYVEDPIADYLIRHLLEGSVAIEVKLIDDRITIEHISEKVKTEILTKELL